MPRQLKNTKPLIYVFCEGESEQAYTEFLKKRFEDVAVIKYPKATGLFEEARDRFKKDPKFKNSAEVTDEIWFFFDVETKDVDKWSQRLAIIKYLRKLRKKPNIKVRLLMTTGCMEYWLMLHYKMFTPPVLSVAEKEKMLAYVVEQMPTYVKGDLIATSKIAEKYPVALMNAEKTVKNLLPVGLPEMEDSDKRNQWLCANCMTFSTVYEAINYLEKLGKAEMEKI